MKPHTYNSNEKTGTEPREQGKMSARKEPVGFTWPPDATDDQPHVSVGYGPDGQFGYMMVWDGFTDEPMLLDRTVARVVASAWDEMIQRAAGY